MRITDGINFKKNSDSCDKYAEWLFKMPEMVVKKRMICFFYLNGFYSILLILGIEVEGVDKCNGLL